MKNKAAVALGRRGGSARAKALTKEERSAIARKAGKARWANLPPPTLYSLFCLYGKRWVRVANEQLPVKQAKQKWKHLVSQHPLWDTMLPKYSIRPVPKSEIRRQILEQYNSKNREGKHES